MNFLALIAGVAAMYFLRNAEIGWSQSGLGFFLACVSVFCSGYLRGVKRKELPYKFKCMGEDCGFKVSATREDFVKTMVEAHLEKSHPQGF